MIAEPAYVGIDVCKSRVDVHAVPSGENWSVTYDATGRDGLMARQKVLPVAVFLVACRLHAGQGRSSWRLCG